MRDGSEVISTLCAGVNTMSSDQLGGEQSRSRGELSYKYQRLRERLRAAVSAGEFAGKLPGERELARRFAANAKTINKALNDLAMEGLVLRHVGRGTFVAGSTPVIPLPATSSRRFLSIHPAQSDGDEAQQVLLRLREALVSKGHRVDQIAMELDEAGELADDQLTYRDFRQVDGVVLTARPSGRLLSNLRRRRLSVVVVDNYSEAVRLPCVLSDQSHGAFVLCERCIQLGHRNIRLLIDAHSLPAAAAAQAGYRAAMQHYGLKPLSTIQVVPEMDWSPLFSESDRAGAALCVSSGVAARVAEEASRRGLSIPADLSVAAICRVGEGLAEKNGITSYQVDAGRLLRWAAELVAERSNSSNPPMVIVPGRLHDRGTLVRPSDGGTRPADPTAETML
jgi:DNA-binding LacI/PurR family transcriptional regulator